MTEIKPCPFCGGDAKVYSLLKNYPGEDGNYPPLKVWRVMCGKQVNCCAILNDFDSEQKAIDAWNMRADMTEIGRIQRMTDGLLPCAKCGSKEVAMTYGDGKYHIRCVGCGYTINGMNSPKLSAQWNQLSKRRQ